MLKNAKLTIRTSFQKVSKSFSVSRIRTFCLLAAMCFPTANEKQLRVAAQWIITLFAWDDAFDDPEEGNLMDDASGASKINKLIVSVLDHPEISKTQAELPVVAAFRMYVYPIVHREGLPYLMFGH